MKETVADAFISRFQLKPDELQALKGTRNGPISEVKILLLMLKCLLFLNFFLRGSRKYLVTSSVKLSVQCPLHPPPYNFIIIL